jgi:anaerobic ribonucleoside-triphosphate reductase
MATTKWPERVRLPRGRHIHAVGYPAGSADRITACNRNAEAGEFLDDHSPVTCPTCQRMTG